MISLKHGQVLEIEVPPIPVPEKEVLRRLGYPADIQKDKITILDMFEKNIKTAGNLLVPKGVCIQLGFEEQESDCVTFHHTDFKICSEQVKRLLRDCKSVILFMVTIGNALEFEMKKLMDAGRMTESMILDAIGSETADAVADWVHRTYIKSLAKKEGFDVTPRFSPGYGDWRVTVQSDILTLCEGERIGITVNASSLMTPQKSVSAIFGLRVNSQETSRLSPIIK